MKSKTESLISALRVLARDIRTDDGVVNACLEEAGRLEELQLLTTRPEPSRLEIAAQLLAAVSSRRDLIEWETKAEAAWAVEQADALIAAAKEGK
jgi:hypothetical protein